MTTQLAPTPVFRGTDAFGLPLYLGQLGTFIAGTNTPQVTYKDSVGVATNTNPVILNARGECNLWLDPAKAYKLVLSDALGNLIWTVDNVTIGNANPSFNVIPTVDNLFTLGNTSFSWANVYIGPNHAPVLDTVTGNFGYYAKTALEILAIVAGNIGPTNFSYPPGNVLRYGADPTGVADSTAAFNAASASMVAYGLATVLDEVLIPPGTYLINGTVYVRKGQRLHGKYGSSFITANNAGTGPTFEMGWGNPANVPTVDSGGQPPQIDNIYVLGGPSSGCVRFNNIAGAVCRDIFFSAPGLAVNIVSSNDLQLRGLFIDVHQGGISISGTAINLQVADVNFFNGKTDIQISGSVSDAQFSNLHHEYNQINCVLFADSAVIKGYKFTDCEYIYNVQYGTFTGTILNRSASAQAQFSACAFHNMPGYAYQYGTGSGSQISFNDCLFDGLRTVTISPTNYNQSTLAAAISTANETIRVSDCIFRNLPCNAGAGSPIAVGGAAQSLLEIDGASYSGNQGASLVNFSNSSTASAAVFQNIRGDALQTLVNNQSTVLVRKITGCTDWFGPIGVSGALHFILLPYQFSNLYQISFRFNQNVGGGAQYRKSKLMYFEKDNDNSAATNRSFLVSATAVEGAANINPLIAVGGEFTAVGGGNPIASSNSGNLAISWTNAYTSESIDVQMLQ